MDVEVLLEKAQQLKGRENGIRWELAEIAYEIVGSPLGRMGATRQLADVCGLSAVDAVEHWAKGWRLYRVIRYMSGEQIAEVYRQQFTVSHFYALWDLGHKYKMSIRSIDDTLFQMLRYKNSGASWSVAAMKQEVDADYPSGKAVNYNWHINRMETHVDALLTFPELPHVWRAYLRIYKGLKGKVK